VFEIKAVLKPFSNPIRKGRLVMVNPTHEQIRLEPQSRLQTFIDSLARALARQWLDDQRNKLPENDQTSLPSSKSRPVSTRNTNQRFLPTSNIVLMTDEIQ
jgi:hypothetical protein